MVKKMDMNSLMNKLANDNIEHKYSLISDRITISAGIEEKYISNENEITIIYDVETSYVLQEEKEIFYFYCIQRNERIKIAEYYSEKEMETNFAIAIKVFLVKE